MKAFRPATRCGRQVLLAALGVLALAAIATEASAEVVDIAWDAGGGFERNLTVPPGKFAEVCGKLPADLSVRWDFEANAPLDFNVHYHAGKEVVFPAKLTAVARAGDTLRTKIELDYCWMWSSKASAPAEITVRMQRR